MNGGYPCTRKSKTIGGQNTNPKFPTKSQMLEEGGQVFVLEVAHSFLAFSWVDFEILGPTDRLAKLIVFGYTTPVN